MNSLICSILIIKYLKYEKKYFFFVKLMLPIMVASFSGTNIVAGQSVVVKKIVMEKICE